MKICLLKSSCGGSSSPHIHVELAEELAALEDRRGLLLAHPERAGEDRGNNVISEGYRQSRYVPSKGN